MLARRHSLAIILLFPLAFLAYFAYGAVMDAVLVKDSSVFVLPAFWFLSTLIIFALGSILWQEMWLRILGSVLVFLPSLLFVPTLTHAAIIFLASLIIFTGLLRISYELRNRIKISVYRSIWVSMSPIIFALSLVISSQYYAHIETFSWQRLVPSFDLGEGLGAWMVRMAGNVSPSLQTLENQEISVDAFLGSLRQEQSNTGLFELDDETKARIQEVELERSKKELSRLLGREVGGDERMNEILSEVLRKKTVAFLSGKIDEEGAPPVPLLPFFLTVLLFFTIYPLGAVLMPIVMGGAAILFALLLRMGILSVRKVTTEQEVLL